MFDLSFRTTIVLFLVFFLFSAVSLDVRAATSTPPETHATTSGLVDSAQSLFLEESEQRTSSKIDDLREKISGRNTEIQELQIEIEEYQGQIDQIEQAAQTLNNALLQLNITDKKLTTDIRITEKKIISATLTIDKLALEIIDQQEKIKNNIETISGVIRRIDELESSSLVEIILSHDSFSAFWNSVEQLERFQTSVHNHVKSLQLLKADLEKSKRQSEEEKDQLLALRARLTDQKTIVEANKENKKRLLDETKNKESNYKELLVERLARREALEREIEEFEARLRVEIDPDSLPPTGTGILEWPLKKVKVTQYFGNTRFASKNPQVYNGKGHNGIDLRASIGTATYAASSGIVTDIGDTDKQCYKASYGKWVLLRHHNGLSTLYAHLSLLRVDKGNEVGAGDLIGYSGNSGYSTGPHLHLAVFATKAVRVTDSYKSRVCGTFLKLPLSAQNGYLNPLSYLPQI